MLGFRRRKSPLQLAEDEARLEEMKLKASVTRHKRETLERAYDAAQPSQYWAKQGDYKSGNAVMDQARATIRNWARYLDENHDLAVGVLDDLTKKIVGCGIQINPQVKTAGGELATKVNKQLSDLWGEWSRSMPESTRTMPWAQIETMVCRTWLRDGEMLIQHLEGNAPIRHRARVPYSIELIEPDYLPFDLQQDSTPERNRVVHGVEMTDWREPVAFWLYREHPGDVGMVSLKGIDMQRDFKRVSADFITHIKFVRRLSQVRGVSIFHSVLRRIEDLKEYEESERVAARVAAAMCAIITKNTDFAGARDLNTIGNRTLEFNPGMVFDDLLPGEDVKMMGSDRPNPNLETFRNAQMRAVASGTGTSYSGVSRNYNGTYSAQRQELVESWVGYEIMREYLYGTFYRPVWQRFARMAVTAGLVKGIGIDMTTMLDVDFVGPAMPWIDPVKEVEAKVAAIEARLASRHMTIRENQLDPAVIDAEIKADPFREEMDAEKAPKPAKPAEPTEAAEAA